VATSLFIRAPFAPTPTTSAAHYTIGDDFAGSGDLVVSIDTGEVERLSLAPAFPGTLTFKPADGVVPSANPADTSASPVVGDLFLELTDPAPFRQLAGIAHFAYPVLLAYLDVALTPAFFSGTVVEGRILDPLKVLPRRPGPTQKAHAFAKGQISVHVSPTRDDPGCVMPVLTPLEAAGSATGRLRFGVRTHLNPTVMQRSLAALPGDAILAPPDFVPMPLAFFYGMLRRQPATWTELAADFHHAHPFFDALEELEDNVDQGRWRRLRVFLPGKRTATPLPSGSLAMLETRATDPLTGELWRRPVNRLGELFMKRRGGEPFELRVVDRPGANEQAIAISASPEDGPAAVLSLQWGGSPDAGDAGLDVTAHVPVDGDPTDAGLFFELMQGLQDQAGMTVDPVLQEVVYERRLVHPLQQLLAQFGFTLVGAPRETFDQPTAWAVREFQVYARLDGVATLEGPTDVRYAERLVPATNTAPYTGEITGIVDAETAAAMRVWRDNQFVCPVVIESWQMSGSTRTTVGSENIWFPTDDTTAGRRVFARDVSGYYTVPATRSPDEIILGRYESFGGNHGMLCSKSIGTAWTPETNVTPDRLLGPASGARPPETISTYKVIAAVARAENEGVFDVLNGYDRAVMSLGVCHWTVYLSEGAAELPAFLAYLQRHDPDAFDHFFRTFGITPAEEWPDDPPASNPLYMAAQAKWVANILLRGLGASPHAHPDFDEGILSSADDANYLRTWHWFYRWVMASRTSEAVQRRQWDFARLRLQQLLAAPWKSSNDAQHFTSVGQVFSSERAAAALLRAHVNAPAGVLTSGRAADRLMTAVKAAGLNATNPSGWSVAQVASLNQALEAELRGINTFIRDTLHLATGFVDPTHGALGAGRGSFQLDATGL
jgi:hypothetical protein